jgi:hypothetical protein
MRPVFLSPPWLLLLVLLVFPMFLLLLRWFTILFPFVNSQMTILVKDLASRRSVLRCESSAPLYTIRLLSSAAPSPSSSLSAALAVTLSSTTWHCRLGHPGQEVFTHISRSADVSCTRILEHLCHACQLGRHVRLPFSFFACTVACDACL